jgi:DnaK suppressor protein
MSVKPENIKHLEEERKRLTADLDHLKAESAPSDERREGSPFGKREEEATEAFELEKRLALEQQLAETLVKVNHALDKYQSGSYGICDQCGKAIETARLEALPYASLCLTCKSAKGKNSRGGLTR